MRIVTSLLPRPNDPCGDDVDVAVVIDVLRATSVMTKAIAEGADRIVTCREVDEARSMLENWSMSEKLPPRPLLCGERGCQPIDGFDLGNSPAEYVSERVLDRTLILTTTNGTRAIEMASKASRMIAASFLNLPSVMKSLSGSGVVHLACAGTEGHVTAEDVLLAGAIIDGCETRDDAVVLNDESILARQLWRSWFPELDHATALFPSTADLSRRLRETQGGRNLVRLGFEADLERCAAIGSVQAIPERVGRSPTTFRLQAN